MISAEKEGTLYESSDSHRKPEKEERHSAMDARLFLYVYLLADGIYLLFPRAVLGSRRKDPHRH